MNRLQQKCLVASVGMHGLLVVLLVVGSAFFVPPEKLPQKLPTIQIVPDELIDDLLAGGGGNPNVKPVEGRQKGDTLDKLPEQPTPPKVKAPDPKPPVKPVEVKPPVKETQRVEPKVDQTKKSKETKPDVPMLKEITRPTTTRNSPDALPSFLKPVSAEEYRKAEAEEVGRQLAARAASISRAIGSSKQGLQQVRRGFKDGTVVEPYGPGGKAYAPYAEFVKVVYDNAWTVDSMTDDGATCVARVTIARNGDVLSARIITPSGNSTLDRSVQRVLNSVRTIGRPFPQGATENERPFTINFNLKNKQGLG